MKGSTKDRSRSSTVLPVVRGEQEGVRARVNRERASEPATSFGGVIERNDNIEGNYDC
jgi:hypothetical protein